MQRLRPDPGMMFTPPEASPPGNLIFRAIYGSHAHGTATPTSDEDWRGVYLLPNEDFLGLDRPVLTYEAKPDQVFWELGHFCRLLLKGNPNIVGMLFAPDDCIEKLPFSGVFARLIGQRDMFIHTDTVKAYMGWVHRELRDIEKIGPGRDHLPGSAKRLSHVPRLLWEIQDAVTTRSIKVRLEGDRLDTVMAIKLGKQPYDEAFAYCGQLLLDVEQIVEEQLPGLSEPPVEWTRSYLLDMREYYG